MLDLFNKSMDDIFVEWESFNITEVKEDLDLNLSNLIRFQGYLQTKLAKNSTPVSKKTRDTIGSTSNRKQFRTVDNHHLTPQLKRENLRIILLNLKLQQEFQCLLLQRIMKQQIIHLLDSPPTVPLPPPPPKLPHQTLY